MFERIEFSNFYFLSWFLGLPIFYISLIFIFRNSNYWSNLTKKGSRTSDLIAFEIVAGFCVTYISIFGLFGWFELFDIDAQPETVYSQSTYIENHVIYPMMIFQSWNLVLCFLLNELKDITMIIHHIVVVLSAYGSIEFKLMQYYALYLYGVVEISNIFLTFMDIFKFLPTLIDDYNLLYQLIRFFFIITFFAARIFGLPYYMYYMFRDCYYLLQNPHARQIWFSDTYLIFILLLIVFVSMLQYFWGYLIIQSTLKFFTKKEKEKDKEKEKSKVKSELIDKVAVDHPETTRVNGTMDKKRN